ncbi:MAG TPA: Rho termination factor N-terminal domain-containing protein [Sinorhizobium sp.]|nr:Rho termination factor N-terminal domain-containing protein [Sinorhizobium sp.]
MAKMRATSRMPRGVLNRYRTRMLTADPAVFEERSPKWSGFYRTHGWATDVADEPVPAPRRRGRPPKAAGTAQSVQSDEYQEKTVAELREEAAALGVELPSGYVKKDDLLEIVKDAETDQGDKSDD